MVVRSQLAVVYDISPPPRRHEAVLRRPIRRPVASWDVVQAVLKFRVRELERRRWRSGRWLSGPLTVAYVFRHRHAVTKRACEG